MFSNFEFEAQNILVKAKIEMNELKHPYIGTEHLVLSILKNDNVVSDKLKKYNLTYDKFKKEIIRIIGVGSRESSLFLYTPLLRKVIENAVLDSKENNDGNVTTMHLFSALLESGEGIAIRIFLGMNINLSEMYDDFSLGLIKKSKVKKGKKMLIEELGVNLTERAKNNELDPVIERDDEIKRLLEVLCRRCKNNPILIGEAGVGKTAIVEELARMIVSGMVPNILKDKKIISLDMASAVAGTKYRGEFEDRMKKILKEIEENPDIILFIDEIHRLSPVVEEYLYSAMEDYRIDIMIDKGPSARSIQIDLNPFTLVGATTRSGLLTAPLRARFGINLHLEYYDDDILSSIIRRSASILDVPCSIRAAAEIASRSRGTPRIANALLRRVRDFAQVKGSGSIDTEIAQFALEALNIDKYGLDEIDNKILCTIIDKFKGGPVGLTTIATALGEDAGTIEEVYEPFLIKEGFMKRTPRGREVTELAYKHLGRSLYSGNQKTLFGD